MSNPIIKLAEETDIDHDFEDILQDQIQEDEDSYGWELSY